MEKSDNQIFIARKSDIKVAFKKDGLVVYRSDKVLTLKDNKNFVFLLPLLEEDFDSFYKISLMGDVGFLIKGLLKAGLSSNSIYWVELSSQWLEHYLSYNNDITDLYPLINGITKDKNYPQKIRHKLLKAMRR